jgi:hypothetical protein
MGSIIRTAANNVGASGVFSSSAFNNASLNSVTSLPTAVDGKMKLISSQTASSDASLSFTSGIDSTYKTYCFKFVNIHPSTQSNIQFNGSTDGGSTYSVTKTTTFFQTRHDEDGTDAQLSYETGKDIAQGTGYQQINVLVGTGNDENTSGELWLFNPSSTTYVKHFLGRSNSYVAAGSYGGHYAGYFNTTSAINAINFQMSSGNIDAGTIALYGIA